MHTHRWVSIQPINCAQRTHTHTRTNTKNSLFRSDTKSNLICCYQNREWERERGERGEGSKIGNLLWITWNPQKSVTLNLNRNQDQPREKMCRRTRNSCSGNHPKTWNKKIAPRSRFWISIRFRFRRQLLFSYDDDGDAMQWKTMGATKMYLYLSVCFKIFIVPREIRPKHDFCGRPARDK